MQVFAKGNVLKTLHIWFESYLNYSELCKNIEKADRVVIHANKCLWGRGSEQQSLTTNLSENEETVFSHFSSTIKNEIRRAEREGVQTIIYSSDDILSDNMILHSFANMYREMYMEKGMEDVCLPIPELLAYAKAGVLLVSKAQIDDQDVVFHSYVVDGENSRLLHSCSEFRVADNAVRNAIGRANKHLHWYDMRCLKNQGVLQYDWGGIFSLENPNGIDKFKMGFGGESTTYYNITTYCTFKGKVLNCLAQFKKCVKK